MGIFEPFRAIGYTTSSVPVSVQRLGTETFVTVSVGKAFQIYNCAKLSLVLVGPQLPKKIRALASYRDYTFAAYGNEIAIFKRAHQERNKPIELPKKPERAPFFLPSIPSFSGEILFKPTGSENEEAKGDDIEDTRIKSGLAPSQFLQHLQSSAEMKNFSAFTDYIKSLSPSTLDMELQMLQVVDDEEEELESRPELLSIELLLDYFIHETSCRNNFDFVQAVIKVFLKIPGETIRIANQDCRTRPGSS